MHWLFMSVIFCVYGLTEEKDDYVIKGNDAFWVDTYW